MYKATTSKDIKNFYDKHLKDHTPVIASSHYNWILRLIQPKPDLRFLDVACGAGFMLKVAQKRDLKVYGVDISSVAVELSKKNVPCAQILLTDGEHLPWHDSCFDYVTSLGSLEHYLHPENGIKEIARVLNKEGKACLMLPNDFNLKNMLSVLLRGELENDEQEGISRAATRKVWIDLIEQNGLKIKKVYKCNEFHSLFVKNSFKIKSFRKFLKSFFIKIVCPLNFSEHFVFIAGKNE